MIATSNVFLNNNPTSKAYLNLKLNIIYISGHFANLFVQYFVISVYFFPGKMFLPEH